MVEEEKEVGVEKSVIVWLGTHYIVIHFLSTLTWPSSLELQMLYLDQVWQTYVPGTAL
jgi:hypothetical protein